MEQVAVAEEQEQEVRAQRPRAASARGGAARQQPRRRRRSPPRSSVRVWFAPARVMLRAAWAPRGRGIVARVGAAARELIALASIQLISSLRPRGPELRARGAQRARRARRHLADIPLDVWHANILPHLLGWYKLHLLRTCKFLAHAVASAPPRTVESVNPANGLPRSETKGASLTLCCALDRETRRTARMASVRDRLVALVAEEWRPPALTLVLQAPDTPRFWGEYRAAKVRAWRVCAWCACCGGGGDAAGELK